MDIKKYHMACILFYFSGEKVFMEVERTTMMRFLPQSLAEVKQLLCKVYLEG